MGGVDWEAAAADCAEERRRLRAALQAVWDDLEDLMVFDSVRQQVKEALGIREFEAAPLAVVRDSEPAPHTEDFPGSGGVGPQ